MTETTTRGDLEPVTAGIRRLSRLLSSRRVTAALARAAGVSLAQQAIEVLRSLAGGEPLSVAEVARGAHMDVGAVSRQLRTLEDQGLVVRSVSPSHRSVVLVQATPEGLTTIRRVEDVRSAHLADALARWSPAERRRLGTLLLRLVDDLQRTAYREG